MYGLLTSGSVLAAFLAGGVALFAPCCIVFLAPGYLALAAKNRRGRLLPLTFVFTAGLALVMVPVTLGISLITATIVRFHAPLYYAAGALMLVLAVLALSGRTVVSSTVNIAVAAGFAVMGGFVIYLAGAGRMTSGPGFQVGIGRGLASVFRHLEAWTRPVPEPVLGLAVLALAAVFVIATLGRSRS